MPQNPPLPLQVLNLEWTSAPSRDRQTATLVCNYLRYMGHRVSERSVFDGYALLAGEQPEILFLCDTRGAGINLELMKYAKALGLSVVSLISEGNFKESPEAVSEFLWGWNRDGVLYEDLFMQWSERTRALTLRDFPGLAGKIRVSGGVGFDLYRIADRPDRRCLLKRHARESCERVIGVGLWDFGIFSPRDPRYDSTRKLYSDAEQARFRQDREDFNRVLGEVVAANPGILFLLKEHPGCLGGRSAAGIAGLEGFPNTLILKNEEGIIDCIQAADFWLVYESTTALESWLMGKKTGLINPSGTDFPRDKLYGGSPNFPTAGELQQAIDHFYSSGELPGFAALENRRQEVIRETIQWDDGLNHVRAGNEIIGLLEGLPRPDHGRLTLRHRWARARQWLSWRFFPRLGFLPRFRIYRERKRAFNLEQLETFQRRRMAEQVAFYEKCRLTKEALRRIRCL